jgi:hypothetical protein
MLGLSKQIARIEKVRSEQIATYFYLRQSNKVRTMCWGKSLLEI